MVIVGCMKHDRAESPALAIFASRCSAGIDTLTGAVGRNGSFHGSGCDAALLPDRKRLSTKILEDTAWQKMALDVEGVLDGGVDREETLG